MTDSSNIRLTLDDDESLKKIYDALAHEVRREILRILGMYQHRGLSFSELNSELQLKPGTFYYHLDKMKDLVVQLPDKTYCLTSLGKKAHTILQESEKLMLTSRQIQGGNNDNTIIGNMTRVTETNDAQIDHGLFSSYHGHHSLFLLLEKVYLQKTPTSGNVVQIILVLLIQSFLASASGLGVLPLYFDSKLYFDPVVTFFQVIAASISIWLFLEFGSMIISTKRTCWKMNFSKELFILIPVTQLPMYVYPLLVIIGELFLISLVSDRLVASIIILTLQTFTSLNMAMATYVTKHIPFDKCFLLSLGVLYLSSVLAWTFVQL